MLRYYFIALMRIFVGLHIMSTFVTSQTQKITRSSIFNFWDSIKTDWGQLQTHVRQKCETCRFPPSEIAKHPIWFLCLRKMLAWLFHALLQTCPTSRRMLTISWSILTNLCLWNVGAQTRMHIPSGAISFHIYRHIRMACIHTHIIQKRYGISIIRAYYMLLW